MEGNVAADEVRHRRGALLRHPLVILAPVQGIMRCVPVVRQVFEKLQTKARRSGMKRHHVSTRTCGLLPHRVAVRKLDGARISIAAHTAQRAKVVVESAILLHQDHDVLDIGEAACAVVGGNLKSACNAGWKSR